MSRAGLWMLMSVSLAGASNANAGPERVAWPEGYAATFVRYQTMDKPKGKRPAKVRFLYVNEAALAAARTGDGLPDGTVLIMEDHPATLGADGEPVLDANGRLVPSAEITNVFVQEKRSGWGDAYPEAVRNGDWDYAWFLADGSRKAGAKFDGCLECHKGRAESDYNFTFTPFVERIKR